MDDSPPARFTVALAKGSAKGSASPYQEAAALNCSDSTSRRNRPPDDFRSTLMTIPRRTSESWDPGPIQELAWRCCTDCGKLESSLPQGEGGSFCYKPQTTRHKPRVPFGLPHRGRRRRSRRRGVVWDGETIPGRGKQSWGSQPRRGRYADGASLDSNAVNLDGPRRGLSLALAGAERKERQGQHQGNEPQGWVTHHGCLRFLGVTLSGL